MQIPQPSNPSPRFCLPVDRNKDPIGAIPTAQSAPDDSLFPSHSQSQRMQCSGTSWRGSRVSVRDCNLAYPTSAPLCCLLLWAGPRAVVSDVKKGVVTFPQ
jgi:hypothetical protein